MKKIITSATLILFLLLAAQSRAASNNASIDFLWETDTYAPVWYKGRSLPSAQSEIKIAAIPYVNNRKIDSVNLIYEWYVNFEKDINNSGKNKNSFTFKIGSYEDQVITVKISDEEKTLAVEESIIFNASKINPQIVFYEENPLYGEIFNKALGQSLDLTDESISIKAEPYFFSNLNNLSYNWEMNDKKIQPTGDRLVKFKKTDEKTGAAIIGLTIQNPSSFLQFAEKKLNINF